MRKSSVDVVKQLQGELMEAEDLFRREQLDEALRILRKAKVVSEHRGIVSAFLSWRLAVVIDVKGDPLAALGHIRQAISCDPLCPDFERSRQIIVGNLRERVLARREVNDPQLGAEYAALVEEHAADPAIHLVGAQHHLALGRLDQAMALLDALAVVSPNFAAAAALRAQVLDAAGQHEEAQEARVKAPALERAGASHADCMAPRTRDTDSDPIRATQAPAQA